MFFKKIWTWLDGNKTLFGMLLMVLVGEGVFGDSGILFELMTWLGRLLTGGGVLHKLAKGTSNTGK